MNTVEPAGAPEFLLETPPDQYDSPWKEVSGRFFPQLVQFFAPDLYEVIDWTSGYEFLEQELREMLRDAETGFRRVENPTGSPRGIATRCLAPSSNSPFGR